MKAKEELNALKEEVEVLNDKLIELTEEELDQVAGGRIGIQPHDSTRMCCAVCGHTVFWGGNYSGQIFDCPECKQHAFMGGDYRRER